MKVVIGVPRRSQALHRLYPMKSSGKYQLHRGDVSSADRKLKKNCTQVGTLDEAIDLIRAGWYPRMQNIETKGAPDIISPERIIIEEFKDD